MSGLKKMVYCRAVLDVVIPEELSLFVKRGFDFA